MWSRIMRIGWIVIVLIVGVSCSVETDDEGDIAIVGPKETLENLENQLEGCDGADNLRDEHEAILRTAGWYNYVNNHTARIDYYDQTDFGDNTVGYAHCGGCYMEVATRGRDDVRICGTIVHEAAHLDEDCLYGEGWAEEAEQRFLQDYADATGSEVAPEEEEKEKDLEIHQTVAPAGPAEEVL